MQNQALMIGGKMVTYSLLLRNRKQKKIIIK